MDLPGPFRLARRASLQSEFRVKMGAVIMRGKRVISTGKNITKTHPKFGYSVHAETNCLMRTGRYDIIGCSIYVYREDRNGNPAIARPCDDCMKVLKSFGIKNVYYTIEDYPYFRKEKLQ